MNSPQPPLPQPQLKPSGITFNQYAEFTPEKLELRDGYYGYGGLDQTGLQLAVLTNMGLLKAVDYTGVLLWIEALEHDLRKKLETVDAQPEIVEAMLNRFNQAIKDLTVVAEFLNE